MTPQEHYIIYHRRTKRYLSDDNNWTSNYRSVGRFYSLKAAKEKISYITKDRSVIDAGKSLIRHIGSDFRTDSNSSPFGYISGKILAENLEIIRVLVNSEEMECTTSRYKTRLRASRLAFSKEDSDFVVKTKPDETFIANINGSWRSSYSCVPQQIDSFGILPNGVPVLLTTGFDKIIFSKHFGWRTPKPTTPYFWFGFALLNQETPTIEDMKYINLSKFEVENPKNAQESS